jgi:hypothetical protein
METKKGLLLPEVKGQGCKNMLASEGIQSKDHD